jgi:hypothetical protein
MVNSEDTEANIALHSTVTIAGSMPVDNSKPKELDPKPNPAAGSVFRFEPTKWTVFKLQWRHRFLKDDWDREEWLATNNDIPLDQCHTPEGRQLIHDILEKKIKTDRVSITRECCRYLTLWGLLIRYYTAGVTKAWWVIGYMFGTFWIFFFQHSFKKLIYEEDELPITMAEDFVRTLMATAALSACAFILYEIPRCYKHLPYCTLNDKGHIYKLPAYCPKRCPQTLCWCWRDSTEHRRKINRLEESTSFDKCFDEEAPTYQFDYDPEKDPDEFLYYKRIGYELPPKNGGGGGGGVSGRVLNVSGNPIAAAVRGGARRFVGKSKPKQEE